MRRSIGVAASLWLWTGCTGGDGSSATDDPTTSSNGTTTDATGTTGEPTGGPTSAAPTDGTTGDPTGNPTTGDPTEGTTDAPGDPIDYPAEILCPPAGDDRCGPPYDPDDPIPPDQLEGALQLGLDTWRFPGIRGACAGCHSPDGYDLARVGFADDAIKRRALDHVDDAQADILIDYLHALRQKYQLTELLHPAKFRPLQPGHLPWPETTPGLEVTDPQAQDERDEAFMHHLVDDRGLLLAAGTIDSLEKAHQAYDELDAIDLTQLRLGLPFDHLSEDGFYGDEHLSVFEWYPGMASAPKPGMEAEYFALVDQYLADPADDDHLWAYYDAIATMTDCVDPLDAMGDPQYYRRACDWMRLKWRSLQTFAHQLRNERHDYPDFLIDQAGPAQQHTALAAERIAIWHAGDFLRVQPLMRTDNNACFAGDNDPCTLLPPPVDDTVHSVPTYQEARIKQSQVFQQSWFLMAWVRDPALLLSGDDFATIVGDYIEAVLLPHYDVHHAFLVAKLAVAKSAAVDWFDVADVRQGHGKIASVRTFSFKQLRNNFSHPPDADPRLVTHRRMFANFARMWLYLVEEDLAVSGTVYDRGEVLRACRFMRTWFADLEGAEDPAMNDLMLSIEALAAAADELRGDAHRDMFAGTGLQPTGTWAEFDEPYQG
ncbi:hypothetical protein [Nannocystis sp. SCPEA4]|uniref:hypothetical protein n=1 Tax=Nannocystis sp. SCPEA4 TaxID=2996787 RepID=UPI00226EEDD3|nr:hypothetical protein [Nannocystis sp. SCPEA4]MCY1058275.1 hypothetical protein [Nannocystis sp. SCPEA4]